MSEKEPTPETEPTTPVPLEENAMDEQQPTPSTPDPSDEVGADEVRADEDTTVLETHPADESAEVPVDEPAGETEQPTEEPAEPGRPADDLGPMPIWRPVPAASYDDRPTSGRHPVNVGHLVMGLAFAGLVGIWALVVGDAIDNEDVRWLLPIPWVLAGVAGLLAVMLGGGRKSRT